jgi:hypothetical protein
MGRTRPKIGDIVELTTPAGFAYAQYTYKHMEPPRYGELIRVLPGLYEERPDDLASLARENERFFTFFPLGPACSKGIVEIVGNEDIPENAQGLPLMRVPGAIERDGKVLNWWLWDGKNSRPIGGLDDLSRPLSILRIMSDVTLINRIVSGWSPEDDV